MVTPKRVSSRLLLSALVVALAMFTAACGDEESPGGGGGGAGGGSAGSGGTAVTGKTFKIGLAAALTGPIAVQGQAAKKWGEVMEKWLVSEEGPLAGNTVEVITYDTKLDPATAASVARRLTTRDEVIAISCCAASTEALQVAAIGKRNEVPSAGGAILTDLTEEGGNTYGWYFRTTSGEHDTVKFNLEWAQKQGYKTAAIEHSSLEYGTVAKAQYEQFAPEYGIEIVGSAALAPDATEASGQASKIANLKPDVVFLSDYPQPTAVIVRDLRNAGYDGAIVSNWSAHNDLFWTIAGKSVENLVAHTNYIPTKDWTQKMNAFYESVHGEAPVEGQQPNLEAHNLHIIGLAIQKALETTEDPTGADVQKALLSIKDYPTDKLMLGAPGAALTYGRTYEEGAGQNPYHGASPEWLAMEEPQNGEWVPVEDGEASE